MNLKAADISATRKGEYYKPSWRDKTMQQMWEEFTYAKFKETDCRSSVAS